MVGCTNCPLVAMQFPCRISHALDVGGICRHWRLGNGYFGGAVGYFGRTAFTRNKCAVDSNDDAQMEGITADTHCGRGQGWLGSPMHGLSRGNWGHCPHTLVCPRTLVMKNMRTARKNPTRKTDVWATPPTQRRFSESVCGHLPDRLVVHLKNEAAGRVRRFQFMERTIGLAERKAPGM